MASKNKQEFTPEEIKEFKELQMFVTKARFARKCEYPDGEAPDILSPEESAKDPEYEQK